MGLILLALAVAGAWRWYDSYVQVQNKNELVVREEFRSH
jgi:hypothetical protein